MKKRLFVIAALALIASAVFAADAYVVKSVTGKVQYESAPGVWKDISVGQKITASTNINTSLNSSLVIAEGDSEVTVKAMQKGALDSLIASNAGSKGLKKGSISTSAVAGKTSGASKGVATASQRASEAKEDVEWEE